MWFTIWSAKEVLWACGGCEPPSQVRAVYHSPGRPDISIRTPGEWYSIDIHVHIAITIYI